MILMTNATLQIAVGVPITTVSKRLGHTNASTTGEYMFTQLNLLMITLQKCSITCLPISSCRQLFSFGNF